jgi:HlyD family secretion protein
MRRVLRWGIIIGLLVGVGSAAWYFGQDWIRRASKPSYQTLKVTRGKVETVVNSTGTVKPVRTVTVGAFVSGPVTKLYVDFNSKVTKDMKLAEIDPRLLKAANDRDRAAVNSQKAERNRIEALLKQAKANEKRASDLREINQEYVSQNEMDGFIATRASFEAQLDLAEKSIEQAVANMLNSTINLGYTTIVSPVNGVVIEKKIDEGQTVASQFQTPEMLVIGEDMDRLMHVYASVDEADVGLITAAMQKKTPVRFTVDAYQKELFEGTILQIRNNSTTNQNVVTYPVVIEARYPGSKLRPGMTANISFTIDTRADVLRVPAAALRFSPPLARVREEDKKYLLGVTPVATGVRLSAEDKTRAAKARGRRLVWVAEGDLLRAVPVRLGLIDGRFAELLEGDLSEGDTLVTGIANPLAPLAEGTTVDFGDEDE